MLSNPRLKGYLTAVPSDEGWLLHGGENELMRIRADAAHAGVFDVLLPLLDGRHTLDDIERTSAEKRLPAELVRGVIERLAAAGIVEEGGADPGTEGLRDQLLFFSRFAGEEDGAAFQARLAAATVDVVVDGPLGAEVARQLQGMGIGRLRLVGVDAAPLEQMARALEPAPGSPLARPETVHMPVEAIAGADFDPASLLVVAPERWDPALLDEINARALQARRPWLLVQAPGVREGTVGPLFVPGETACWQCLQSRLASHMSFHPEFREFQDHLRERRAGSRRWGGLHPHAGTLAGLAAAEAAKLITGYAVPELLGRFVSLGWFDLKTTHHHVLRVPRCMACRPPRVQMFPWQEAPVEPLEEEV